MPWISSAGGPLFFIVVLVIVAVVAIERMVSGRSRDRRLGDGRGSGESPGSGAFGELVDVFQPSRVHLTEEKERQRLDIVQAPSTAPPIDVDLESGVVVFSAEVYEPQPAEPQPVDGTDAPR
ncbi:DUF6191 domain-containing protein [Oerskovia turbata]|uniref:DUF6191 domain-containing protein n=1 Tax=Oerskovia turbata TaxID=1713 RepID=UPI00069079F3|nr:DUF6191 domain-containing protein [Oerskovia turbata]